MFFWSLKTIHFKLETMSNKYKGRYRIPSARWQNWDYSSEAAYFVTICTDNRAHYFGSIKNNIMQLSNIGVIATILWFEIKNHCPNVELGAFVVMPNHIHGIIIIPPSETSGETKQDLFNIQARKLNVGKKRLRNPGKSSLSSIVGSYKSAVSKYARRLGFEFAWQKRFHDRVIKDPIMFERVANYIDNNVVNWDKDRFYK